MERSFRLASANLSLRRAQRQLELCQQAAARGEPYFTPRTTELEAWLDRLETWRDGTAGAKRVIALSGEVETYLRSVEAGYDATRREAHQARIEERRAAARAAEQEERRARSEAARVIARRQALDSGAVGEGQPTLFEQGYDLRESGPG